LIAPKVKRDHNRGNGENSIGHSNPTGQIKSFFSNRHPSLFLAFQAEKDLNERGHQNRRAFPRGPILIRVFLILMDNPDDLNGDPSVNTRWASVVFSGLASKDFS
jgi:hypothetical protein